MAYFIDVICQIKPHPSNWESIFKEYQSLIGDNKTNFYLHLLKDVAYNQNKLFIIKTLCYSLSIKYNDKIAELLKSYYPRFTFANDSNLSKTLNSVSSSIKSESLKLEEKKSRLKSMQNNEQPKPNDWNEHFLYMTKFLNTKMTIFNTTVAEYCTCMQMIKEMAAKSEKTN